MLAAGEISTGAAALRTEVGESGAAALRMEVGESGAAALSMEVRESGVAAARLAGSGVATARAAGSLKPGFSCGVALGYAPVFLDYMGLNAFHCGSVGLQLKYAWSWGGFVAARPELASGTMATKFENWRKIQFNLPSMSLPLFVGYDFRASDWLSLSAYAGAKARYGRLSYTPDGGLLVLKHDYSDAEFKRLLFGASVGLSAVDTRHAPNSAFSLEFSKFFVPKGYRYYLWGLSVVYSYWF